MAAADRPPHFLASLAFVLGFAALLALSWAAKWLVVQGYPPLRISSLGLGAIGLIGAGVGVAARRWMWAQHRSLVQRGEVPPAEPPRPTLRDWIVSGLYGLAVIPLATGSQSVAIAEMPLAVVVITAMGGEAWRHVLVRHRPAPATLVAVALAAAGMTVVALGPDAGPTSLMILLVGIAPLGRAIGGIAQRRLVSAPKNQVISVGVVVAAIAQQIAGIERGEVFGDAPFRSTLALAAPIAVLIGLVILMLLAPRAHPFVVARAGAGTILATVLLALVACDQPVALATWIAAALVTASVLVKPTRLGEESKP
jgi:drug/metabolite transporter (DMT)-like permease